MSIVRWFDSDAGIEEYRGSEEVGVEWLRIIPFVFLHVACLGVIWVGWSWTAIAVAGGLSMIRIVAITGVCHRYACHRTFKANRFRQFPGITLGEERRYP